MAYSNVWDETYPPGSLSADQINEAIVYWAKAVRERMNDVLGITDWATASQPITFSSIKFRGTIPSLQGGSTGLYFIDSTGVFNNGVINDAGDYTARRHLIATSNLISNGNLVFNLSASRILPGATSISFRDFANANDNLIILDNGAVTIRNGLTSILNINSLGNSSFISASISGGQGSIARVDSGNVTGASTIDWSTGNNKRVRLTGNTTFTFTNPIAGGFYFLELQQDGTGSRLVTWPGSVLWPASIAPSLSLGINKIDIVCFYYNGANYLGGAAGFAY